MTVQGMIPAGKNPFGLPVGKAKTRADGNPADPGFASLLAMLVVPAVPPAPGLATGATGGDGPPAGMTEPGTPVLSAPAGAGPVVTSPLAGEAGPLAGFKAPAEGALPDPEGLLAAAGEPLTPVVDNPGVVPVTPGLPGASAAVPPDAAELPVEPVEPPVGDVPPPAVPPGESEPPGDSEPPGTKVPPEETAPPVEAVPADGAHGKGHEKKANEHRNNPDLTRGLERAALVSQAREHRPTDAPNADKFPIPPTTTSPVNGGDAVPDSPDSGLPASLEGLRADRHEPPRLMEAISRAITNTQDGQYKVTLRLHPEHLGEVRLQLQLSGREVHTILEVASPEARQALESRGDQLRQNLTEAGLTLSGFEVSTGQNRQAARDQREALEEQLRGQVAGGNRRTRLAAAPPTDAIERIRNAGRRSGRLDTMA